MVNKFGTQTGQFDLLSTAMGAPSHGASQARVAGPRRLPEPTRYRLRWPDAKTNEVAAMKRLMLAALLALGLSGPAAFGPKEAFRESIG